LPEGPQAGPHADESHAGDAHGRTAAGVALQDIPKDGKGWIACTPPAADAPGPLTLAVCNFFGEVARASDHIEARMTLDRRKLSITVELALPDQG
jgi:hypothetical protein